MKRKRNEKDIFLLPRYFKLIGLFVIAVAFVPITIAILMHIKMSMPAKELFKTCTLNAFILGLLLIAWSKDKIEDELTFTIRLKSMSWTFIWGVLFVIITPLIDFLFYGKQDLTAQSLIMSMLFVYLIMYYLQKRGR